jgi:hypothetical protein
MRALLISGLLLLLLGLASLFVPIPHKERHGLQAGGFSVGFETESRQTVHPAVSAVLIGGGIVLIAAGKLMRR